MKAILNLVAVLSLAVPAVSDAKSLSKSKIQSILKKSGLKPLAKRSRSDKCVNFSGVWEGQCVERDSPQNIDSSTMVIEQDDCRSLSIDNLPIPDRGSFSAQIAPSENGSDAPNISVVMSGNWNDAQSRFTNVLSLTVPDFGFHSLTSTRYELEGETLVVSDGDYDYQVDANGNPVSWHLVKYDCRYTKKP